ncbi:MAG: PilZ domain-containing protein [Acidobacteria bacterium]|nr:PilZ domain-containing protein [Acidobacteriota bacterium]
MTKILRRHDRVPYRERVTISWTGPDGEGRIMRATGVDISRSGFSLKAPHELRLRSYVSFRTDDGKLAGSGSIRYCSRTGPDYLLGIEFSGGLQWDPNFKPREYL